MKEGQALITKKGEKLIYDYVVGDDNYFVFLGGLGSSRNATKATYFKQYCKEKGYSYICFDYLGHGDSDLKFSDCDLNMWLDNIFEILEHLVPNQAILIGSSLGGWLALRAAEINPNKIKAIIGLATAADFTENLMWQEFSDEVKAKLSSGEIYNLPVDYCDGEYAISMGLIESGREHMLLDKDFIKVTLPVRLVQGMQDQDVPYNYAYKIIEKLQSDDTELILVKNADHRLSEPYLLQKIANMLEELIVDSV